MTLTDLENRIKESCHSFEIQEEDFIEGPKLNKSHKYLQFMDIGYNITTVNRTTGKEHYQI